MTTEPIESSKFRSSSISIMAEYEECRCWECKRKIGWIKVIKQELDIYGGHPVLCSRCAKIWLEQSPSTLGDKRLE